MTTHIEQKFVIDTYSEIAHEFSSTRYNIWKFVREFLQNKEHLLGLDIGCGNGKNMTHENIVGIDNNEAFVQMCEGFGKEVLLAECTDIPFIDNAFDYAMCISVIHHLSTEERRIKCIVEMIRVLRKGGTGIFNVWSYENQDKHNFVNGDNYVPWNSRDVSKTTYLRYYNIMNHDRFMQMVNLFHDLIRIDDVKNEKGNWIVQFTKI
uniref:Methyltransferase type 11 domain-containing protein n=1 Tax=Pyramimonas orientalis virus TaxID=455367 RepID=A0A7M3UP51_POV01|nr:hypothetical protein HWQ62_00379 [Pyramimonas orientalis virus]